jgi:dTDP-4-dehydrorhamnose 3,5-epimerase
VEILKSEIDGIVILKPKKFFDDRGFFLETFEELRYSSVDIVDHFVQDNQSHSTKGVLRGLHCQRQFPQAQLVTVLSGNIFDVVVDLRPNSDTFCQWMGRELGGDGPLQIYMPPGFAHGFCVLSESADLHYKVTRTYSSNDESGILWSDPDLSIDWPIKNPILKYRDANFPPLSEFLTRVRGGA